MKKRTSLLRLIVLYFKINLASAMEYRGSFFLQAFGTAVSNATFVFFWWVAFRQRGGTIGGYGFNEVMFIWAVCSSAFGFANIFFGNLQQITRIIVSGELDTYLLQPKNVLVSLLCARTNLSAWGDLIYGFVLLALTRKADFTAWCVFVAAIIIGGFLIVAIAVTAHTFTFYLGDASLVGGLALEFVINFCIYPEGIYRGFVRALMYTAIPAAFIVHVPLRLAANFNPAWFVLLLAAAVLYCCFAWHFFFRGLKKYESGNLMITRL
ncbi:MAG TPA: hypothetical protein GX699_09235 [Firmicutes bacterium]|nr:hypothetical protein [Bacillota bacterium]